LQELLAKYPNLLAGDQMDRSSPRRWLPVKRETGVPSEERGAGRWSVDHLFLDQDGIPTLVETKRSSNRELRRQVVGQMLDYAANAVVYWPVEGIRTQFEATSREAGLEPDDHLLAFLGPEADAGRFWQAVQTNLAAGKVRLVFVADVIPPELRRIVEFLNIQMRPAEILAVEIRQYVGHGLRTLVPAVIGLTVEAQERKTPTPRESRQWDESSFLEELAARRNAAEADVARRILGWAKDQGLRLWWGKGTNDGSFFPMTDHNGAKHWLVSVWTYGRVQVQLGMMKSRPPFDDEAMRRELRDRLNEISGVDIPADALSR
jgi:hypothetical protein